MNSKKNIFLAILLILSIILFAYAFFIRYNGDEQYIPSNTDSTQTEITEDNFTLTASYIEDNTWEYNIVGQLPNPCYTVTTDAIVAESYPEQVSIVVNVEAPDADVMCAQVIEPYEYTGEFQASEEATVKLLVE